MDKVRVDRWLWAVRLTKTRSGRPRPAGPATQVNGARAKPASTVKAGDTVRVRAGGPGAGRRGRAPDRAPGRGRASAAACLVDNSPPPPPRDPLDSMAAACQGWAASPSATAASWIDQRPPGLMERSKPIVGRATPRPWSRPGTRPSTGWCRRRRTCRPTWPRPPWPRPRPPVGGAGGRPGAGPGPGRGGGLRVGLAAAVPVVAASRPGRPCPRPRRWFLDRRATAGGTGHALYYTLVRILLGTAAAEETIFRGAVLGLLLQHHPRARAVAVSSALFGCWHVLPTLDTLALNLVGETVGDGLARTGGAVLVMRLSPPSPGSASPGCGSGATVWSPRWWSTPPSTARRRAARLVARRG